MTDKFSKAVRSRIMSRIRPKNTSIEKIMFALLRAKGISFQRHYSKVVGTPDIAFPKKKIAVFIDGDFWHGYRYPVWKKTLNSNFWKEKVERNRARDRRTFRKLRYMGWKVIRLWEHQILRDEQTCLRKILMFL